MAPCAPRLPLRDTAKAYGKVTRLLHWGIGALMLWQFVGIGLRLLLGRHPVVAFFVGAHQAVGSLLFGLIVLRLGWAALNRGHRPAHAAGLAGLAARLGHLTLYALMLLVPVAALLRAYGSDKPFAPMGFAIFPAQQPPIGCMVDLGNALHGAMGWLLALLIAGHVAMVALHEGIWRDGTLARMAGRGRAGF